MDNFTQINAIKEEPEDEPFTYMNLSDTFQPSPSSTATSSYFAKPPSQIKTEPDEVEDCAIVTNLDSIPKAKEVKKRGRPKKTKEEGVVDETSPKKGQEKKLKQDSLSEHLNVKKKRDRFNGMPEEEVLLRLLPDILAPNLDILIIGINPGLFAAYVGHHYAGPGNHFWKCLYLSGLITEPMNAYDDFKLPKFGIGFTNICSRTTRGSSDLRKSEIKEGGEVLKRKIMKYRPKIAVFNGKGIYEVFSGKKDFCIGKQPEIVDGTTHVFVMPSSSARCAQLPRASDKVPFFLALKKFRDYLKGDYPQLDESEIVFPNVDMRHKPDVKCEKIESECAAELTPEEIIMRSEYLEALEASAEGREIPAERLEKNLMMRRRLKGGSDDEDSALTFEDEESSQSSGSSDALRGIYNNVDGSNSSNFNPYCYSKNPISSLSSSFEVISSTIVKEEPCNSNIQEDSVVNGAAGPIKSEKDESTKSISDLRATFSPKPLSQNLTSVTSPHNPRSSPLYTNLGFPPPKSQIGNNNITTAATGKHYQKGSNMASSWQHHSLQPSPSPSHSGYPNNNSSDSMTTTDTALTQRQSQSSPYSPQGNNNTTTTTNNSNNNGNSSHMSLYHNVNYGGTGGNNSSRPSSQPATIPYFPNGSANSQQQPQQMPFGHSGNAASSQYGKGGRPPIPHQWSNGAGSMPPPTLPHNGTHPYYGRNNPGLPSAIPSYPPNSPSSSSPSPYKGAASGMSPILPQHNGMTEKNQRNSATFNGSYNNVPNYYAC